MTEMKDGGDETKVPVFDGKKYSRNCIVLLLFLSWLAYTAGNVGRMDYAASMVAIIDETGATKASAGLVSSFFFFAYGAGQLINGLLCHKYNSRLFIFGSLVLAAVANLCMPLCETVSAMKWLWLINGIVQSVLWSSLVKLQSEYLSKSDIRKLNTGFFYLTKKICERIRRNVLVFIPRNAMGSNPVCYSVEI